MSTGAGLATAFFRLYVLHALEPGAARPAALLASLHASEGALPLETGAFSRALHQLLDAGLVLPAPDGGFALTAMGRSERVAQRAVWARLLVVVNRLLADQLPPPVPPSDGGVPLAAPTVERVADAHRERVVLAEIRDAARRARDAGEGFGIALAEVAVSHPQPARARAMLQRCLRETLGTARSTFASGALAVRYGGAGVCLVVRGDDVEAQKELLRARLLESLGAMSASVRAFAPSRHAVRVGCATWAGGIATSRDLLAAAERALVVDAARRAA